MLSNVAETFHSSAKLKNKQLAKIWGLKLKKQRFGDTLYFPEHLEDSPFKIWYSTFYKGPPFDVFSFPNLPKIQRGDPYKMSNVNVVQSCWNLAQLREN